jgi:hypothetical protein
MKQRNPILRLIIIFTIIQVGVFLFGELSGNAKAAEFISVDRENSNTWTTISKIEPVYSLNGYNTDPVNRSRPKISKNILQFTNNFAGTRISNISEMGFTAFNTDKTNLPILLVDILNLNSLYSNSHVGRLVFEPYTKDIKKTDLLSTWNALTGSQKGNWWFIGIGRSNCIRHNPCTWKEVLKEFPNATIPVKTGRIYLFRNNLELNEIDSSIDTFIIQIKQRKVLYNFSEQNSNLQAI